jgi:hypothetical protein
VPGRVPFLDTAVEIWLPQKGHGINGIGALAFGPPLPPGGPFPLGAPYPEAALVLDDAELAMDARLQ